MVEVEGGQAGGRVIDGLNTFIGECREVVALISDHDGLPVVKDLEVVALQEAVSYGEEERLVRADVEGAGGEGVAPCVREGVEPGIGQDDDPVAVPTTRRFRLIVGIGAAATSPASATSNGSRALPKRSLSHHVPGTGTLLQSINRLLGSCPLQLLRLLADKIGSIVALGALRLLGDTEACQEGDQAGLQKHIIMGWVGKRCYDVLMRS